MSASAILKEAEASGVTFGLNGDKLAIKFAAKPSPDLLVRIREHKAGIVELLRQEAASPPVERQAKIAAPDNDATTVCMAQAKIHPAPDTDLEVEIEDRKGTAAGGVPEPYLDAWARLQCQKPMRVSDAEWRQAIDDAGRFLDQWGSLADEFQWTPGERATRWKSGRAGLVSGWRDGSRARTRSRDYGKREEFLERKGFRRWAIAGRGH